MAPEDLTVDAEGHLGARQARRRRRSRPPGTVYFHSASGERKATGSYFTPDIVVEHLLDRSLEPVLARHLDASPSCSTAATRPAQPRRSSTSASPIWPWAAATSSSPLSTALRPRMRDFLTQHPIPHVAAELRRLQAKAEEVALGDDAVVARHRTRPALLRRQIARRCIYGIDVNPLAVELARLGLWITTFVPGLPDVVPSTTASSVRTSLTGVGTLDEALEVLDPTSGQAQGTMYGERMPQGVDRGKEAPSGRRGKLGGRQG